MRTYILLAIIFFWAKNLYPQISEGGKPVAQVHNLNTKSLHYKLLETPPQSSNCIDCNSVLKTKSIGACSEVNFTLETDGNWLIINDLKVWRLALRINNVSGLGVFFNRFKLPINARLFIYSPDYKQVLGAYTYRNNKINSKLNTDFIMNDSIIIEYSAPQNSDEFIQLSIGKICVIHNNSIKDNFYGNSDECEIDVNCNEGANWQSEKRAVCRILYINDIDNEVHICSGTLLNNSTENFIPYFLTANHCINSVTEAESAIFFFNYESPICDGSDGNTSQSISGAHIIATPPDNILDFTLLELSTAPPPSFQAYYAGWNVLIEKPNEGTCIHHPAGDVKKVSHESAQISQASFGGGYASFSHWRIRNWDFGISEAGSSGSPLFNEDHLVVGNLTGGNANCNDPVNDYFSILYRAWTDYECYSEQLKIWLDPLNITDGILEGKDHNINTINNVEIIEINIQQSENNEKQITPEIIISNHGYNTVNTIEMDYKLDNQEIITLFWEGELPSFSHCSIFINNLTVERGYHQLMVNVKKVNTPEISEKKTKTKYFAFDMGYTEIIEFHFQSDTEAANNQWELRDELNNLIYCFSEEYENGYVNFDNRQFQLGIGKYSFILIDDSGNGISNCETGFGSFKIENVSLNKQIALFDEFEFQAHTSFQIWPESNIAEPEQNLTEIFPNPTADYLNLIFNKKMPNEIEIFDISSRKKLQALISNQHTILNLQDFPQGIYVLKIHFSDKIICRKIIKTN